LENCAVVALVDVNGMTFFPLFYLRKRENKQQPPLQVNCRHGKRVLKKIRTSTLNIDDINETSVCGAAVSLRQRTRQFSAWSSDQRRAAFTIRSLSATLCFFTIPLSMQ
jgi:hypothetical protein